MESELYQEKVDEFPLPFKVHNQTTEEIESSGLEFGSGSGGLSFKVESNDKTKGARHFDSSTKSTEISIIKSS